MSNNVERFVGALAHGKVELSKRLQEAFVTAGAMMLRG